MASLERLTASETVYDLEQRLFALPLHGDVHTRLCEACQSKHRGMPASPDHRQPTTIDLRSARHRDRIPNGRTCQHRDTEAEGVVKMGCHRSDWIVLQARIDDDNLVTLRIQMRPNRHQRQRHGKEYRLGVIQNNLTTFTRGARMPVSLCRHTCHRSASCVSAQSFTLSRNRPLTFVQQVASHTTPRL